MARVLEQLTLYRDERFHAAFPSIARLPDGDLLLAMRRGRDPSWLLGAGERAALDPFGQVDHLDPRSHIVLQRLDAESLEGKGPLQLLPIDPEAGDQDPSLLVLPDGLLLASFSWYPLAAQWADPLKGRVAQSGNEQITGCRYVPWGCHTSFSPDFGSTWDYHHRYLLPDGSEAEQHYSRRVRHLIGGLRGQPLYVDGQVLLALFSGWPQCAVLFEANAVEGEFQRKSLIAADPEGRFAFQEPALCSDENGRIACFMRTHHAGGRLASACSDDRGASWSDYRLHDLVGHPFHALRLVDGRIFLSYGYRSEPFGIRARLLDDLHADPDNAEEMVIRDDATCADVGYPWAVELAPGRVLVAYYETDRQGVRMISGSVLEL